MKLLLAIVLCIISFRVDAEHKSCQINFLNIAQQANTVNQFAQVLTQQAITDKYRTLIDIGVRLQQSAFQMATLSQMATNCDGLRSNYYYAFRSAFNDLVYAFNTYNYQHVQYYLNLFYPIRNGWINIMNDVMASYDLDFDMQSLRCESTGYKTKRCEIPGKTIVIPFLVENISSTGCSWGHNWGKWENHVWVSDGCRAVFNVAVQ